MEGTAYATFLDVANIVFTCIFGLEVAIKIIAFGPMHYFYDVPADTTMKELCKNPLGSLELWNCFDASCVLIALVDRIAGMGGFATFFRVFRCVISSRPFSQPFHDSGTPASAAVPAAACTLTPAWVSEWRGLCGLPAG